MHLRRALFPSVVGAVAVAQFAPVIPSAPVAAADIAAVTCDEPEAAGAVASDVQESFVAQTPERVVDTRIGTGGVDGALDAGCTLSVDTSELLPGGATAVALSLTVISPDVSFFTAFPCAAGLPETSNVNARPTAASANLVIVEPDDDGLVCIYSSAGGHVIVDVSGSFGPGPNRFGAIDPARAADTRIESPAARLPANTVKEIDITGNDALGVPDDAFAVALNVAAVRADAKGFLVTYPCGGEVPLASNLNFVADENRAASAIVDLSDDGTICVSSDVTTHVIADVTGYYAPEDSAAFGDSDTRVGLRPVVDTRVADTRVPALAGDRFGAGTTQKFDLSDFLDDPDATVAVALNVVAVRADAAGFLSVYPCTDDGLATEPTTSSLNYDLGQTANLIVTKVSDSDEICVYTSTAVDMAIDLFGAFDAAIDGPSTTPPPVPPFPDFDIDIERRAGSQFEDLEPDQEFDGGEDYTLRCAADGERLRVGVDTEPQVAVTVNGQSVATGADTVVDIATDGLVTVTLAAGSETQAYNYRCLPPDFPRFTVDTTKTPAAGWYTYGTAVTAAAPIYGRYLVILDERFVPVWFKSTGSRSFLDFRGLSDGSIVAAEGGDGGFGIRPAKGHNVWNLSGDLLDLRRTQVPSPPIYTVPPEYSGEYPTDFHEYEEIPSADGARGRAVISYPPVNDQDLRAAQPVLFSPAFSSSEDIVGNVVQEFDAAGNLVWNWDIRDHFGYDEVRFGARTDNGVDPFHVNSIDRVDEPGCEPLCDYVVSARHLDAVFRIDRATGTVEWILSSADVDVANKDGAPRLAVLGDLYGGPKRQHDARLVGDRLTLFDNQTATDLSSRIAEYRIDTDNGTATLVRNVIHPEGLTSTFAGNGGYTPDGSILAAWSVTEPLFVEYDADGNELQRLTNDPTDGTYRIHKYAPSQFDAAELRRTSGDVIG